ncbi:MAG: L,D-transpeptidase [Opitutales bacterium]
MDEKIFYESFQEKIEVLGVDRSAIELVVSIPEQRLWLFANGKSYKRYSMSSSKRSPSCQENSLGSPWGLHEVCGKIGGDAPEGMVFKGRQPTGQRYWEYPVEEQAKNLITSRILRLRGLEQGLNTGGSCDTFDRYIYIHGTNHEEAIGKPASSGCLQLTNADVIELFDLVPENSLVLILKD